jgi:hypothetical protein
MEQKSPPPEKLDEECFDRRSKVELRSMLRLDRFIQEAKINGSIDSRRISLELVRVLHELDGFLHHFPRELRIQ